SIRPASTAIAASTITLIGTPNSRLNPSQLKPVFPSSGRPARLLKVRPLVISSAIPRATYITPRVATKAGTLNHATSTPFSAPSTAPTAQVSTTTAQTGG